MFFCAESMMDVTAVSHQQTHNWAALYEQQLTNGLRRACEFVQTNQDSPETIRPHFPSLLMLLARGLERPFLHSLAADLIMALHPLPYLWGRWEEWLHVSRQSINLFAALERPLLQADMLAGIVDILFELGRYDDACHVFAEMWAIPLAGGVIRPLVRAGHRVSTRLLLAGRVAEGIAQYERQLALFTETRSDLARWDKLYAGIYLVLQETLIMRKQGRQHEAVTKIEAAIAQVAAWPEAPPDLRREVHHHHGGIRLATGEYNLSVMAMEQAIQCALEMADPFTEASLYVDKALPLWVMGKFDQVETAVRRGIYLCEKLHANWRLLNALSTLVDVFVVRGEFEKALRWGERLIALAQQLGDEMEEYNAKTVYGIALLHLSQTEKACAYLEECLPVYREKHLLRWLSLTESNLSCCWADLSDAVRGRQFARQAVSHACEVGEVTLEIIAWRSLSRFQTGREKRKSLMRSRVLAREHHAAFGEAASLLLLAESSQDESEKVVFWQQAADLLQEMGIESWLNGRSPQNPPHLPLIA